VLTDAPTPGDSGVRLRPLESGDLPRLIDLTIETFRPFYEGHVRSLYGEELFRLHHGEWEQDYRDEVSALHDPAAGRWVAVAELGDRIAGYVAWRIGEPSNHGQITMLAVAGEHRRLQVGRALCLHAVADMKARNIEVVGVFTGGDRFHAPARRLYDSLDFIKVPIAAYIKKI
jgi:ribosomal protein S18 acetylase RimI-like enzyme